MARSASRSIRRSRSACASTTPVKRHGLFLRTVGDRLVFAPPLIIEEADIEEIAKRLKLGLDDVAKELKSEGALDELKAHCRASPQLFCGARGLG